MKPAIRYPNQPPNEADIPVEQNSLGHMFGLMRTNGAGRILIRASFKTFAGGAISSIDAYDGAASGLASTAWTPVLFKLGPAPATAALMDLIIMAEEGAELYFANLAPC